MHADSTMVGEFHIRFDDEKVLTQKSLEHYHATYELDLFVKAHIDIFIKDQKHAVTDGDILLLKPYDLHKLIYNPNAQYVRYVINFKKEYIEDVVHALKIQYLLKWLQTLQDRKLSIKLFQKAKLEMLFKALAEQFKMLDQQNDVSIHANIKMNLVLLLNQLHERTQDHALNVTMDKKAHQVQKIIQFIDTHYRDSLTLDGLAAQFFLSKFHLSHIFKEITGFSVVEYLQYRRIIEAQKLLENSSKSITEICYECGFNNIQHFCRVFKKLSHTTPRRYREMN